LSTSAEDFILQLPGRNGISESRLHGATSAAVTETGGGSSTNGSETPRKKMRKPENWKNVAKAKRA